LKDLGTTLKKNKKILERQMQSAFVVIKGKMKEKRRKKSWELTILKKKDHPIRCWERLQKTNKELFCNLNIIK
jgi:polyhydroxyalkanoate synthesis regulator protein